MKLQTTVKPDAITDAVSAAFDYTFTGTSEVEVADLPPLPKPFCLGLIVGPSGSGKSTLLRSLGNSEVCLWSPDRAVASHFATAEEAMKRLAATGLNSIPTWCRPYQCLSTGEQFRADMARRLESGARIDEFTSVVDRVVARSCSVAIARYARAAQLTDVVLASCHYDIIPWLDADWVYDTATGVLAPRGSVQRPQIKLDLLPCSHEAWAQFSQHHYLSGDMNRSARCWLVVWDGTLVGFASALAFPNGNFKNAWREHRTVVLPDFQGMGFGVRISDAVAQVFVDEGARYFSKTAHPRMGEYRERSPLWKPTSKNKRTRGDYLTARTSTKEGAYQHRHAHRMTYSHEYVGPGVEL